MSTHYYDDDGRLHLHVRGREIVLTPELARRIAIRMAEREPETKAWHDVAFDMLDWAAAVEEAEEEA